MSKTSDDEDEKAAALLAGKIVRVCDGRRGDIVMEALFICVAYMVCCAPTMEDRLETTAEFCAKLTERAATATAANPTRLSS